MQQFRFSLGREFVTTNRLNPGRIEMEPRSLEPEDVVDIGVIFFQHVLQMI